MKKITCLLIFMGILLLYACGTPMIQSSDSSTASDSSMISEQQEITPSEPQKVGNPMECDFRLETVFDQREKEYYLYIPPTSNENNAILVFDPNTNIESGSNTAVLNMDTGELKKLPYTTENIQMDEEYFYWLGYRLRPEGGAIGQICQASQDTPEESKILYETPEDWIQDDSLFLGDNFLVWGEYKISESTGNIEEYRIMAFDLEKNESFVVDTIYDLYGYSLSLSVNSGMIAYGSNPVCGYSLKDRKVVIEQPSNLTKSAVYDGTYLAYVEYDEASNNGQLILTMPGTSLKRTLPGDAINVDIVKGEFVIYSTTNGLYVYSISEDNTVFYSRSPSDEPGFNFGTWFHTNKKTGTTLFKNIIKGNSENGPATTVSALFMDFSEDE